MPTKKAEPAPQPKVEAPDAGATGQGHEPLVAGKEAESNGRQQSVEPALKGYCPAAYSLHGKALTQQGTRVRCHGSLLLERRVLCLDTG